MQFRKKAYWKIGIFCFASIFVYGQQDQKLADSLIVQYNSGSYQDTELDLLAKIVEAETDPDKYLEFSEMLINKASKDSSFHFLYIGYLQKGNALKFKGNNVEALQSYFKSLEYAERASDEKGMGSVLISIAGTYTVMGNSTNAQRYFDKGIVILRKVNDSIKVATALLNAGDDYFNSGKLDSALIYTAESTVIFEKINYPLGQAYSLGNAGMIYAEQEKDSLAEVNINKAITILEKLEDYYPISVYLTYMSDIYSRKNDLQLALSYATRSLELAAHYRLKEQISDANLILSELYEQTGDPVTSYKHYKEHIAYRDSVINVKNVQQLADLETNYQVSQKQVEVDLLSQQKKTQKVIAISTGTAMFLIGLFAVGLYRRNKFIQKTKRIIEEEKNRSEALLLNILPEETAFELKDKGKVQAKKFDSVTVLFTDFKDFTLSAEQVAPELLVESIDYYFKAFDAITTKYDLEKIKTIGDAYMCAGGLPTVSTDHAKQVVKAANEIAEFVKKEFQVHSNRMHFEIRIGVHTGPVVAGIVGDKKWQYDIWGDSVNTASRMESNGQVGKVNISKQTYDLIKKDQQFTFEKRGEIQAKGKGEIEMYFVELTSKD